MNILDEIIAFKKKEVADRKKFYTAQWLEQSIYFNVPCVSLRKSLLKNEEAGIIAEIKRKSPSRGMINAEVSVEATSVGYIRAGATALSILTDANFFGGNNMDLTEARIFNACPILRKDFIIDPYQVTEAKSIGADVILLIAATMGRAQIKELSHFAHSLGLEVLLEIHNEKELIENLDAGADMIGVNNRDLKTFEMNIAISQQLAERIPDSVVKISESGIDSPEVILELKQYGYRGFLMGQTFMKNAVPEAAATDFISSLRKLESQTIEKKF